MQAPSGHRSESLGDDSLGAVAREAAICAHGVLDFDRDRVVSVAYGERELGAAPTEPQQPEAECAQASSEQKQGRTRHGDSHGNSLRGKAGEPGGDRSREPKSRVARPSESGDRHAEQAAQGKLMRRADLFALYSRHR